MTTGFHEVLFPTAIARGCHGGPERRTDVIVLGSGAEERNSRWAASRRRYNAGYGVASLDDLHAVLAFFEERRGRLYGFRWHDAVDFKSCPPGAAVSPLDQQIGMADGATASFRLAKTYGGSFAPWTRFISKPVAATVAVAVDGATRQRGTDWVVDEASGLVTFRPGRLPTSGQRITAGFEFHVPVRFDTDTLEINLQGFRAGAIPDIPVIEIRT